MKISNFEKSNLPLLRVEITNALAKVGEKYVISLKISNIRFSGSEFTTKLTARTEMANTLVKKMESASDQTLDGLRIGQTFKHKTKTFTITKFEPSMPKNCVSITNQNGKPFKCSMQTVKALIGK